MKYGAFREEYDTNGENYEQEIVFERLIPHPLCLKLSFVRGNDLIIKPDHISLGIVEQVLLITKIDGTDPGKAGAYLEDLCLVFFSKNIKAPLIYRKQPLAEISSYLFTNGRPPIHWRRLS